ncbi:hypothetical protein DSO57_1009369 [Entomophthora muscae]|uniref:Uncharacterized protein n=1 Tax=Entomophthora muscae TaxID=34485 RepID=A0ACC2TUF8_9FUNG|nr:hypothetical protein DSO57_1009369 [Entomophthora muscae]
MQRLAENVKGLSLIIGGHTHSYLGPKGSKFREKPSEGEYPTEVTNLDGKTTYIVQAHEWAYLLGHIDISYGTDGYLSKIRGQTILLNSTVPVDKATNAMVKDIRKESDKFMYTIIGNTNSSLVLDDCQLGECNLGSYIADAMLKYHPTSDFALINTGAIQDSIRVGDITRGDVCSVLPIETAMVQINQTGQQIRDLLQRAIRKIDKNSDEQMGVQVSGIQFTYNSEKIMGKVQVLDQSTQTYRPIELSRNYTIATLSYVAIGGDNFVVPQLSGFEFLDSVETFVMKHIQSQGQLQLPTKYRIVKVDDISSPIPALVLSQVSSPAKSKIFGIENINTPSPDLVTYQVQ